MATTARAVSGLDASAQDAMDLHSDSGYDFGDGDFIDGDIELDLEPSGSAAHDDDYSIQDAGTDNGLDIQTASADHDDFMVDNEDLIEEEVNNEIGGNSAVTSLQSPTMPVPQPQTLAPPDEDLIDYSDDEDTLQVQNQGANLHTEEPTQGYDTYDTYDGGIDKTQSVGEANEDAFELEDANQDQYHAQEQRYEEEQEVQEYDQSNVDPFHQEDHQSGGSDWKEGHSNADGRHEPVDQGNNLDGKAATLSETSLHGDEIPGHEITEQNLEDNQSNEETYVQTDVQKFSLPPVTVNYSGNEFWLFQQHDTDDNGDWLLDDTSLAEREISHVFQACRNSLGEEITVETELGFRFDHMHNMELYEDNTVCAYVTLQRLVNLYHELLAHDDIADPEPFCVTLQLRPRFFTLVGEMEKYAKEGNGFMKLNADIDAGETHFSNVFSSASTEHGYGLWENEEEQGDPDHEEHNGEEDQYVAHDYEQRDEEYELEKEQGQEKENQFGEDSTKTTNLDQGLSKEQSEQNETYPVHLDSTNPTSETKDTNQNLNNQHKDTASAAVDVGSAANGTFPDDGEDLIDYSDDEDDGRYAIVSDSRKASSTSSSTVQGEESFNAAANDNDEFTNAADPTESGGQSSQEYGDYEDEDVDNDELSAEYADLEAPLNVNPGQNYAEQVYQEDEQAYNSPERLEAYDPNEDHVYPAQPDQEGDTHEYYGGPDDQTAEEQIFSTLPVDVEDGGATGLVDSTTNDGLVGVDDLLSIGDTQQPLSTFPDDAVDIFDPSVEFPDQAGVVEQPAVMASSVAEPIATSSVDLVSPQGQKRTIDEAGDDWVDASDPTDAKRSKV